MLKQHVVSARIRVWGSGVSVCSKPFRTRGTLVVHVPDLYRCRLPQYDPSRQRISVQNTGR